MSAFRLFSSSCPPSSLISSAIQSILANSPFPSPSSSIESFPDTSVCPCVQGHSDHCLTPGECQTDSWIECQVCEDRASGFHYGVFACEGCKGFFRRSIHHNVSYRKCMSDTECILKRNNRNRCQWCRLNKCVRVGMSKEAVRFGRVPKREKERMMEYAKRKKMNSCQSLDQFPSSLIPSFRTLSSMLSIERMNESSVPFESLVPSIQSILQFMHTIPQFASLHKDEQIYLLKMNAIKGILTLGCVSPTRQSHSSLSDPLQSLSIHLSNLPINSICLLFLLIIVNPPSYYCPSPQLESLLSYILSHLSSIPPSTLSHLLSLIDSLSLLHSPPPSIPSRTVSPLSILSTSLLSPSFLSHSLLSPPLSHSSSDEPLDLSIGSSYSFSPQTPSIPSFLPST